MARSSLPESGFTTAPTDDQLQRSARILGAACRVLVITGAGMSADSGLPTYRGIGGLYNQDLVEEGVAIEDVLSGPMFERDPALTWKYIAEIERACRGARPNAGHYALADLAPRYERFCVLTQNVDGFHADAGIGDLIEMHGNIHRLRCTACAHAFTIADYAAIDTLPPRCQRCRGILRPDVVLFGEMLPTRPVTCYEQALDAGFDLVMTIGTTAVFPYIAAPVQAAWRARRDTLEINPDTTEISRFCGIRLRAGAANTLVRLRDIIRGIASPPDHGGGG